ncbi:L,D-transpeptidase [Paenibacillus sp. N3.4]|uniref:L,D-transpeptidase family protein n=1 Tax=Paenibacillus sp. N3.4 TaxID=2603222 RepID=UPI0011CA9023|nr:L,D-transpeptidase [Paenibacillus sp. N3.4]TXK86029.1 L,D-transpeptidase [Paenibacillus sp. N3.4]
MKDNRRNDQLEKFFQHNPIEDPLYLKKYVKEHPDHKMAWYLLGREYAAKGKEGKAAYCFAQSGEIYEAFERQKITLDGPLPTFSPPVLEKEAKNSPQRKSGVLSRWLPLLALLLLFAVPAAIDVAKEQVNDYRGKNGASGSLPTSSDISPSPTPQEPDGLKLYVTEGDWGKKLQQVLSSSGTDSGESVIMEAPRSKDGKWQEWNRSMRPLLGVVKQAGGDSKADLTYYQSQVCSCQVADSSALLPVISNWMNEREQAIVLQSAIQAYQQRSGGLPDKAEQLTQPYPDNLLPGLTPTMKETFPQAVSMLKEKAKTGNAVAASTDQNEQQKQTAAEQNKPVNTQPKASADPLREPLQIIIDTDKHRLVLVSGNYVIRSYPVGLGGDKTPQGEFKISEKVRNPNGKSNGEFGSRGMTLSDTLYAIHGTNKPTSVGKDESHGCVRMLQADVEELYNMVPHETKVTIGKGVLPPDSDPGSGGGDGNQGSGAGRGNPNQSFVLPLQTNDSNPAKKYKWLD